MQADPQGHSALVQGWRGSSLPGNNALNSVQVNDWRAEKAVQLSWTAEQWAYLLSAAEMGLRHEVLLAC